MPTRPQRRTPAGASGFPSADTAAQRGAIPDQTTPSPAWQVIEIEGEATAVADASSGELAPADSLPAIPDCADEVIVSGLDRRQLTVTPGESGVLHVAIRNQGDRHACFLVQVEGWIDEQWISFARSEGEPTQGRARCWLHPGEHALLTLVIAPSRVPASAAGERPFAVVVRAPEYGGRVCRLGAQLTIAPYNQLALGQIRGRQLVTTWRRRTGRLLLPITNGGNSEAALFVQAHDAGQACKIDLRAPGKDWQGRRVTFCLPAGETTQLLVRITPPSPRLLSLKPRRIQVRLAVGAVKAEQTPLATSATLVSQPLISLAPLLISCLLLGLLAGGVLIFATFTASLAARTAPLPAASAPVVSAAPLPPQVVTIIVNLAQPAPASVAFNTGNNASLAPVTAGGEAVPPLQAVDSNVPIVQPDQVTSPGAPFNTQSLRPATASSAGQWIPADGHNPVRQPQAALTYQQMFQEVALRYDLSWRVLAAQAYLESGFDALALGNSGDMGLMQILPDTWREWAPQVEANDPFDAYSNTLVAAAYLDHLRSSLGKSGHSQIEWMLVAYNWGIDKLLTHLDGGGSWDDLPAERRQYATDILRIAETLPAQ